MSATSSALSSAVPRPKPSFWRHASTLSLIALMMQAPWYPIVGMGLTLMRMGQAKSAWIDGAVYAVMALPSVAAIGLSLYALYRWRSARWIPLAVTLSCASLLGGCWIVRLLWDEFAAQVLHSSNANWPYL